MINIPFCVICNQVPDVVLEEDGSEYCGICGTCLRDSDEEEHLFDDETEYGYEEDGDDDLGQY